MIKDKNRYRLKYQYELLEKLLDKNRKSIRDAMRYKKLGNSTEDPTVQLAAVEALASIGIPDPPTQWLQQAAPLLQGGQPGHLLARHCPSC